MGLGTKLWGRGENVRWSQLLVVPSPASPRLLLDLLPCSATARRLESELLLRPHFRSDPPQVSSPRITFVLFKRH